MRNSPTTYTAAVINILISLRIKAAHNMTWQEICVLAIRLKKAKNGE